MEQAAHEAAWRVEQVEQGAGRDQTHHDDGR
jgi:hypothetical protein